MKFDYSKYSNGNDRFKKLAGLITEQITTSESRNMLPEEQVSQLLAEGYTWKDIALLEQAARPQVQWIDWSKPPWDTHQWNKIQRGKHIGDQQLKRGWIFTPDRPGGIFPASADFATEFEKLKASNPDTLVNPATVAGGEGEEEEEIPANTDNAEVNNDEDGDGIIDAGQPGEGGAVVQPEKPESLDSAENSLENDLENSINSTDAAINTSGDFNAGTPAVSQYESPMNQDMTFNSFEDIMNLDPELKDKYFPGQDLSQFSGRGYFNFQNDPQGTLKSLFPNAQPEYIDQLVTTMTSGNNAHTGAMFNWLANNEIKTIDANNVGDMGTPPGKYSYGNGDYEANEEDLTAITDSSVGIINTSSDDQTQAFRDFMHKPENAELLKKVNAHLEKEIGSGSKNHLGKTGKHGKWTTAALKYVATNEPTLFSDYQKTGYELQDNSEALAAYNSNKAVIDAKVNHQQNAVSTSNAETSGLFKPTDNDYNSNNVLNVNKEPITIDQKDDYNNRPSQIYTNDESKPIANKPNMMTNRGVESEYDPDGNYDMKHQIKHDVDNYGIPLRDTDGRGLDATWNTLSHGVDAATTDFTNTYNKIHQKDPSEDEINQYLDSKQGQKSIKNYNKSAHKTQVNKNKRLDQDIKFNNKTQAKQNKIDALSQGTQRQRNKAAKMQTKLDRKIKLKSLVPGQTLSDLEYGNPVSTLPGN